MHHHAQSLCKICNHIPHECLVDITENVAYYVVKIPSVRHLSTFQNKGVAAVSAYSELELNMAFAQSSFVILIFSVIGTHTFDGYGMMTGAVGDVTDIGSHQADYPSHSNTRPLRVRFIRRGTIPFAQVGHIRDDLGLHGRSVSSAKDGARLGVPAGRALCRSIDKRAYKDDAVLYRDERYVPRVLSDSLVPAGLNVRKEDKAFASMTYAEYAAWYADSRIGGELAPSYRNIVP